MQQGRAMGLPYPPSIHPSKMNKTKPKLRVNSTVQGAGFGPRLLRQLLWCCRCILFPTDDGHHLWPLGIRVLSLALTFALTILLLPWSFLSKPTNRQWRTPSSSQSIIPYSHIGSSFAKEHLRWADSRCPLSHHPTIQHGNQRKLSVPDDGLFSLWFQLHFSGQTCAQAWVEALVALGELDLTFLLPSTAENFRDTLSDSVITSRNYSSQTKTGA